MQPDERDMKAADEKSDREQPESLGAECLRERVSRCLRPSRSGLFRAGTTSLTQADGEDDPLSGPRGGAPLGTAGEHGNVEPA